MSYRGRGRGGYHYNNNNGNNRNNFSQQNVNQFVDANSVPVEILGWNGATPEECVNFISRKCKIVVSNAQVDPASGILKGYVKNDATASDLLNWSGVKFAGQSLRLTKAIDPNSLSSRMGMGVAPPNTANGRQPAGNTIEIITQFLKSRYRPDVKLLDLSIVQQDPSLTSCGFFASMSTTSKFFPALMKLAGDLKLEVDSVDLSGNNLSDLNTISTLAQTFPFLKNLSLVNNNFNRVKSFEIWKHKLNFLRELLILGNPILNNPNELNNIKDELLRYFPRLIVLNGEIVRNEDALNNLLTFPFDAPQAMFFQDEEVQNISTNFVANYIKLWDSNRQDLLILYQNESQFSMQVDSAHPHTPDAPSNPRGPSHYNSGPDFGNYLSQSRNLTRVSSVKSRFSRVASGPQQIFQLFSQLPKTRHDLMTKPHLFSMESYRFPQLGGIIITLHGCFDEVGAPDVEASNPPSGPSRNRYNNNNNRNKKAALSAKSFDRTFVIIPGVNGSMIVASDLLSVRPFTGPESWTQVRNGGIPAPQQQQQPPQQAPPIPTPAGAIGGIVTPPHAGASPSPVPPMSGQPNGPTAADLPPQVKANLNPQQQDILVKVLLETKLNMQYAVMLCEQSNWDFQSCSINFKNSVGSLPPDAYAA